MAALVAAAAATGVRLLAAVVIKADITEAAMATFAVEVAAVAAVPVGVGRSVAAAIVVILDGKATSAFALVE
jgi:hypothetical protein